MQEAARRAQELEMEMLSSTSPPERTRYSPIPPSHHQLTLPDPSHHSLHSTPDSPAKPEKNGHAKDHPKIAKIFEIQSMPNGKTRTSLKTLSRRKLSQQKEKKATQMLAIVLGESALAAGQAQLGPALTEGGTPCRRSHYLPPLPSHHWWVMGLALSQAQAKMHPIR